MSTLWSNIAAIVAVVGVSVAVVVHDVSMDAFDATEPANETSEGVRLPSEDVELTGGQQRGVWQSFEEMHEVYTQAFVDSEGFGMNRIVTFDEPYQRSLFVNGVPHRVSGMGMIGHMHAEPIAYAASWLNIRRDQLNILEQREITPFERTALESLKQGAPYVWMAAEEMPVAAAIVDGNVSVNSDSQASSGEFSKPPHGVLIAALRATQSCTACHDVQQGYLLGAFVYNMRPVAENAWGTPNAAVMSLQTAVNGRREVLEPDLK